jgi:hypothetical protein
MPTVEVFEKDEMTPLFQGDFSFLPRIGEYISKDAGGISTTTMWLRSGTVKRAQLASFGRAFVSKSTTRP